MPAPASTEQRFQRLLALARFDAISLIAVASPATLWALATQDWYVAACGAVVVLCGANEWRAQRRLARGHVAALGRMCLAQLVCLAAILAYAHHLAGQTRADRILALLPSFTREQLFDVFPDDESAEAFLLSVQHLMVAAIALVAILYQGGMAFFYLRARTFVSRLLAEPPVIPGPAP